MMNEENILHNLKLADESAFEFIFKKYFPGLCQYARGILKSHVIAEEIVEELFLSLWENAESINISTSLRSYLYKSVYNRCLKYIRHVKVENKYLGKVPYILCDEELYSSVSYEYPLENIIAKELDNEINKAIENLPDQCREIFLLHRHNDLTYPEIAKKLKISINTVKTQMARALKKMRDALKSYLSVLFF